MALSHTTGLSIRLTRMGCKNRPFYLLGALPTRRRPNLLPDEVIGNVDPIPNEYNEIVVSADLKRLAFWMGKRGRLSIASQNILGMIGWTPIPPQVYIKAMETREKERSEKTMASEKETKDEESKEKEFIVESVVAKKRIC